MFASLANVSSRNWARVGEFIGAGGDDLKALAQGNLSLKEERSFAGVPSVG